MEIPDILKIAMDAGIGRFLHDQVKITMPPRAKITVDLSPPYPGIIWVTFALTFGNIKEDSFEIWHWSGDGRMKRHLDPTWYSLGIGASFVYPLWIYCSISTPHTIEIENITDEWQTADVCWWVVEITEAEWPKFRRLMRGLFNLLWILGGFEPVVLEELFKAKLGAK